MINGLPDRLKELRIDFSYSQKEVATKLGVSPSIISGYETGERTPSLENLLALSYLYKCSTDYLLGKDTSKPDISHSPINIENLNEQQIKAINHMICSFTKE